jgi:hypothetical protein
MHGQTNRSWSVAELVPLILLGLVGLSFLFAAPTKLRSSTTVPQRAPRQSPAKPPSANKMMLVHTYGFFPAASQSSENRARVIRS